MMFLWMPLMVYLVAIQFSAARRADFTRERHRIAKFVCSALTAAAIVVFAAFYLGGWTLDEGRPMDFVKWGPFFEPRIALLKLRTEGLWTMAAIAVLGGAAHTIQRRPRRLLIALEIAIWSLVGIGTIAMLWLLIQFAQSGANH